MFKCIPYLDISVERIYYMALIEVNSLYSVAKPIVLVSNNDYNTPVWVVCPPTYCVIMSMDCLQPESGHNNINSGEPPLSTLSAQSTQSSVVTARAHIYIDTGMEDRPNRESLSLLTA